MPTKVELENNDTCLIRVSGKLSVTELHQVQAECEKMIQQIGEVQLLVILDGFEGWQKEQGWEDSEFAQRNDAHIRKFAIVGDEQWKDLVYVFTLKGLRPVPIEFFSEGQVDKARAWLAS